MNALVILQLLLLSPPRLEALREALSVDAGDPWAGFSPDSEEGRWCLRAARRLGLERSDELPGGAQARGRSGRAPAVEAADIPFELPQSPGEGSRITSTQEAFGRTLVRLSGFPKIGERLVTSSPDVSVFTGLAGWINKVGQFSLRSVTDFERGRPCVVDWKASPQGRHIELGISEMNLFSLLGQLVQPLRRAQHLSAAFHQADRPGPDGAGSRAYGKRLAAPFRARRGIPPPAARTCIDTCE